MKTEESKARATDQRPGRKVARTDRGATSGARVCTCYAVPVVFAADICELMTSSMNAARDGEKQHRRQEEEHSKGLEKAWRCRHCSLAS